MNADKKIILVSAALIIALGFIVYANSFNGTFIWDDKSLIQENFALKSWSYFPKFFFSHNIIADTGKTFHLYRPMQMITYLVDRALWGMDVRGYHLTNILLHVFAALAAYFLILALFGDKLLSLAATLIFLVHPVHTEAVTYISGRADPLVAVFILLSVGLYVKFLATNNLFIYAASLVSCAVALLSRENAIILPLLLVLCHYARKDRPKTLILAPFFAITVIYILVRMYVLKLFLPIANVPVTSTCLQRLPGFFVALTGYTRILFFPFGLHMEYGNGLFSMFDPRAFLGLAILIALLAYAFIQRERDRLTVFSILWFVVALIPVSNIYPTSAYMAEHWLYLPSLGFCLAVAGILRKFYEKFNSRVFMIAATSGLVIFYSSLTVIQNNYWRDLIPFYERTLKYAPDSKRVLNDLAIAYDKAGRRDEALVIYNRLLNLDPNRPDTYVNMSAIYVVLGRNKEAIELCKRAIALEPINATAHNNLAVAYYAEGAYDLAVAHCMEALRLGYKVNPRLLELLKPYLLKR